MDLFGIGISLHRDLVFIVCDSNAMLLIYDAIEKKVSCISDAICLVPSFFWIFLDFLRF